MGYVYLFDHSNCILFPELRSGLNELTLNRSIPSPQTVSYTGVNGDRNSFVGDEFPASVNLPQAGQTYCSSRVFFPSVPEMDPYADSQRSVSCNELRHYSTGQQNGGGGGWDGRYVRGGQAMLHSESSATCRPPLRPPPPFAASTRTLVGSGIRPVKYNPVCSRRSLRNGKSPKLIAGNDGQTTASQGKLSGLAFFLKSPKVSG